MFQQILEEKIDKYGRAEKALDMREAVIVIIRGAFKRFSDIFVQTFKILVDS